MWFWEWRHCDLVWQLIPSKRFPERNKFQPVCKCGVKPERKWKKVK